MKAFIPTTEDGGSSRQLYYYMYGIAKWVSQFVDDETDWEEVFSALGLEWKNQLDMIKKNGIHTLQLTNEQKSEIDAVFSELFDRSSIANDREMYSFVARMAINLCRIMSEVAVLRALEPPESLQPPNFLLLPFHTRQVYSFGQPQGRHRHPLERIHLGGRLPRRIKFGGTPLLSRHAYPVIPPQH